MIFYIHMWGTLVFGQQLKFLFFMIITSVRLPYTHLLIMHRIHTVSAFFCAESFGTYMIFEGRHLLCDELIYYCFPSQSVKASRSRKHGDEMFDVHVRCSEYQQNELISKMKRGMRSLHHHLQVTFSQSVSCLVAYFCRTMI